MPGSALITVRPTEASPLRYASSADTGFIKCVSAFGTSQFFATAGAVPVLAMGGRSRTHGSVVGAEVPNQAVYRVGALVGDCSKLWVTLLSSLTSLSPKKVLAWRPGGYLRSSGVLFAWMAVRTIAQMVLFVLIARAMGAAGYGALISVIALASVFTFAVMGAAAVLVREGARRPDELARLVRDMLRLWCLSIPLLSLVAFSVAVLALGDVMPVSALAAIVFAEVVCASAVDGVARVFQSQDNMSMMGLVSGGLVLARLGTFVVVGCFVNWTPATWAYGYMASSAAYLLLVLFIGTRVNEWTAKSDGSLAEHVVASLPFSFSYSAQKIQAEMNKPILARVTDTSGAGSLSAAQRFTDLLLLPVLPMLETLAPRVYRAQNPMAAAFTLGLIPLVIAALGGGGLVAAAGLVPQILGPSFESAVGAVTLLAALPAVQVFRWLLGAVMTGLDLHRYFYVVHGTGAFTSVLLVAVLAPRFGVLGAVAAAYITEFVLIVLQAGLIHTLCWRTRGAEAR